MRSSSDEQWEGCYGVFIEGGGGNGDPRSPPNSKGENWIVSSHWNSVLRILGGRLERRRSLLLIPRGSTFPTCLSRRCLVSGICVSWKYDRIEATCRSSKTSSIRTRRTTRSFLPHSSGPREERTYRCLIVVITSWNWTSSYHTNGTTLLPWDAPSSRWSSTLLPSTLRPNGILLHVPFT